MLQRTAGYLLMGCSTHHQWDIICSTTDKQLFMASASFGNTDPLNQGSRLENHSSDGCNYTDNNNPLSVNCVVSLWSYAVILVAENIFPWDRKSALDISNLLGGLSSLALTLYRKSKPSKNADDLIETDSQGQANSPANDHWELKLSTTPTSLLDPRNYFITFLSNGSIDHERTNATDLAQANATLQPTISALQTKYGQDLDFWQLTNWFFVSLYWTLLADFGQVTPVTIGDNSTVP